MSKQDLANSDPCYQRIRWCSHLFIDRFEEGLSIYDIDFEFFEGVERNSVAVALTLSIT